MKAPRFQNSGRFAGFVANNEMNNSSRRVMELLVFLVAESEAGVLTAWNLT
jgi:hypothetical protein